jgi:hypothetical protein
VRRTALSFDPFVDDSINVQTSLLTLFQLPISVDLALTIIRIFGNLAASPGDIVVKGLIRTGVVTSILDLLSFFNPQEVIGRASPRLTGFRFIEAGIDSSYASFHRPLMRFAAYFLNHSDLQRYTAPRELISHVMGFATVFEDVRVIGYALLGLKAASEHFFDDFSVCFFGCGFFPVITAIIQNSEQLRFIALKVFHNLTFHVSTPRDLERLLDCGLSELVLTMIAREEPEIRFIGYECMINIASFQGVFSSHWLEVPGLIENLAVQAQEASFQERSLIIDVLGNLLTKSAITEDIMQRIDFAGVFVPILNSNQVNLVSSTLGILSDVLSALIDLNLDLGQELIAQLYEEGLEEILGNLLENGSITDHTEVLAFEEQIRQFDPSSELAA